MSAQPNAVPSLLYSMATGRVNRLSLNLVFQVARIVDSKTPTLQHLDALKTLGAGSATKLVFPLEFTSLVRPLVDHASEAMNRQKVPMG